MFAIHEIDFANTRLSPNASWHLESRMDLGLPFYGTFRILINKRDSELSSAAARGAKDRRQQALLDELEAGVTAILLELAIDMRTELAEQEWPLDSVGDVLGRILDASGLADVALPAAHDLPDFRTHLAGAIRAMGRGRLFA
jgi:hypothetical protein